VFAALGGEGALDVVLLLLVRQGGLSVGDLVSEVKVSQTTVTRRLQEMETAGLVEHPGRLQPFRLRERERLIALLQEASTLAEALLALDEEAERSFRKQLDGL
jgi:DNA-binding MarR family transcriptional regulator